MSNSCCGPSRSAIDRIAQDISAPCELEFDTVSVPGGKVTVGTTSPGVPDDGEAPIRRVRLNPFRIGVTAVTNAQFSAFVSATGYVTESERFGWSFVFHTDVPRCVGETLGIDGLEWWRRVPGANWRAPNGPGTYAPDDHPVTQVSWNDAIEFSRWASARLPTEAEWEHAARGGLSDVSFPWGGREPNDTDFFPCNIWQGAFPSINTGADGWQHTAPVRSFEPNGYGLYCMVGNVWEWTSEPFKIKSLKRAVKQRLSLMKGYKLSKGGSFLCHRSYCFRYRIPARMGNSPNSAAPHHGFRLVWDA